MEKLDVRAPSTDRSLCSETHGVFHCQGGSQSTIWLLRRLLQGVSGSSLPQSDLGGLHHTILTFLAAAKSCVAPIKKQNIPCLELCRALLLTSLLYEVPLDLNIPLALLSPSYYIPTVKCFLKGLSQRCVSCKKAYAKESQLNA